MVQKTDKTNDNKKGIDFFRFSILRRGQSLLGVLKIYTNPATIKTRFAKMLASLVVRLMIKNQALNTTKVTPMIRLEITRSLYSFKIPFMAALVATCATAADIIIGAQCIGCSSEWNKSFPSRGISAIKSEMKAQIAYTM